MDQETNIEWIRSASLEFFRNNGCNELSDLIKHPKEVQFEILISSHPMLVRIKDQIAQVASLGITPEHLEIIGLEPSIARGCVNDVDATLTEAVEKQFSVAFSSLGKSPNVMAAIQNLVSSNTGRDALQCSNFGSVLVNSPRRNDRLNKPLCSGPYPKAQNSRADEVMAGGNIADVVMPQYPNEFYASRTPASRSSANSRPNGKTSTKPSQPPRAYTCPGDSVDPLAKARCPRADGIGDFGREKVLGKVPEVALNSLDKDAPFGIEPNALHAVADAACVKNTPTSNKGIANFTKKSESSRVNDVRYSASQITVALHKIHSELEKHKVKLEEKINMSSRKRAAASNVGAVQHTSSLERDDSKLISSDKSGPTDVRASKSAKREIGGLLQGSSSILQTDADAHFLSFKTENELESGNNAGDIIVDYEGLDVKAMRGRSAGNGHNSISEPGSSRHYPPKTAHEGMHWPELNSLRTQSSKSTLVLEGNTWKNSPSHHKDKWPPSSRFQRKGTNLKINNVQVPKKDTSDILIQKKKNELEDLELALSKHKEDLQKYTIAIKESEELVEQNKKKKSEIEELCNSLIKSRKHLVTSIEAEQIKILNETRQASFGKSFEREDKCAPVNTQLENNIGDDFLRVHVISNSGRPLMDAVEKKIKELNIEKDTANLLIEFAQKLHFSLPPIDIPGYDATRGFPESIDRTITYIYTFKNRIVIPFTYVSVSTIANEIDKYCGKPSKLSLNTRSYEQNRGPGNLHKGYHNNSDDISKEKAKLASHGHKFPDRGHALNSYDLRGSYYAAENSKSSDASSSPMDVEKSDEHGGFPPNAMSSSAEIFDIFTNSAANGNIGVKDMNSVVTPSCVDIGNTKSHAGRRSVAFKTDPVLDALVIPKVPIFLDRIRNLVTTSNISDKPGRYFNSSTSLLKLREAVHKNPTDEDAWVSYALKHIENGVTISDIMDPNNGRITEVANVLMFGLKKNPKSALLWNTLIELRCRSGSMDSVRKLFVEATKSIEKSKCEQLYWRWVLLETDYKMQLKILDAMIKSFAETYIMMVQPLILTDQFPPATNIFDVLVYKVWLLSNNESISTAIDYLEVVITSTSIFDVISPGSEKHEKLSPTMANINSTLPVKYFSKTLTAMLWLIYFYMIYFKSFPDSLMGAYPYYFMIEQRAFLINWHETPSSYYSLSDVYAVRSKILTKFLTLVNSWGRVNSMDGADFTLLMLNLATLYKICKKRRSEDDYFESTTDSVYELFEDSGIEFDLSSPHTLYHVHVYILEVYGNLPKALAVAKLILSQNPKDVILWSTAAKIAIRLGQLAEAVACLVNCSFALEDHHQLLSIGNFFDFTDNVTGDTSDTRMDTEYGDYCRAPSPEIIEEALCAYERLLKFENKRITCSDPHTQLDEYQGGHQTKLNTSCSFLSILCLNYISLFVINSLQNERNTKDIEITCSRMFQEFEKNIQLTLPPDDEERVFWKEYLSFEVMRKRTEDGDTLYEIPSHLRIVNVLHSSITSLSRNSALPPKFASHYKVSDAENGVKDIYLDPNIPKAVPSQRLPLIESRALYTYMVPFPCKDYPELLKAVSSRHADVALDIGFSRIAFWSGLIDLSEKLIHRVVSLQPLLKSAWRTAILLKLFTSGNSKSIESLVGKYRAYFRNSGGRN